MTKLTAMQVARIERDRKAIVRRLAAERRAANDAAFVKWVNTITAK